MPKKKNKKTSTENIKDGMHKLNSIEEESDMEPSLQNNTSNTDTSAKNKKSKKIIIRLLRLLFTLAFFVLLFLFINELLIQPYKLKKSIEKAKDLYHYVETESLIDHTAPEVEPNEEQDHENNTDSSITPITPTPIPDPNRDDMGRLIKFKKLLEVNEDVKGWLKIDNINGENDTKIDYVVMQSNNSDPEYYLDKNWATKEYLKAGSLFLDSSSSIETNAKNLIIHGHNMTSSDDMFHYLLEYNELSFLKEHPIISFDTIYEEALWKVFSIVITPGSNERGDFFPFVRSNFSSNSDFIDYIYQTRVRSIYNIDDVDINENDQILTLSTCSYELSNYRTIVLARKVRDGEEITVDTDNIKRNKNALYPPSFYKHYGGKAPLIPSFEEALQDGQIPWYSPMDINN